MESPNFEVNIDLDENEDSEEEANFSVDMDWDDGDDIENIKFDLSMDISDDGDTYDIASVNFDISLDSSDEWYTDDIDSANFDVSLDISNAWNTDDSINFDVSCVLTDDCDEQDGSGHNFSIEQIRERRIVKFNVQGYEYRVRVNAFHREMSFDHAVRTLHTTLRGKICI